MSLLEGLQAHLVEEERGLLSSWRLELSVQLTLLEGEELFSTFVPGCAESTDWEEGSVENGVAF